MNKEAYKKAFSGVGPSADAAEKALQTVVAAAPAKRYVRRAALGLLAAVLLLGVLALTANAATDGHLYEGVKLIIRGKNLDLVDFIRNYESYVDEDGTYVRRYTVVSPEGEEQFRFEVRSGDEQSAMRVEWNAVPAQTEPDAPAPDETEAP